MSHSLQLTRYSQKNKFVKTARARYTLRTVAGFVFDPPKAPSPTSRRLICAPTSPAPSQAMSRVSLCKSRHSARRHHCIATPSESRLRRLCQGTLLPSSV
ncbi:hypothetical protein PIB30_034632 [Stylosanthes scabra]|uniref:Uncharacterized protein n=1 Tax=Stylosanthes scabra TaxID=79078 RepID=A0ABU6YA70_9FABA|nr:hypothetical protein [Stylosanthes scabra]